MPTNVTAMSGEGLVSGAGGTQITAIAGEGLVAPYETGTAVRAMMGEGLVSGAGGTQVTAFTGEALVSPNLDWIIESQAIYDRLRKHIPEERVAPAEPFLRGMALVLYDVRAKMREMFAQTTRAGAQGRWMDQLADNMGVKRLPGESDAALGDRFVKFGQAVTREHVEAVLDEAVGVGKWNLYEWFDWPMALLPDGAEDLQYGFYCGASRLPVQGGFVVEVTGGSGIMNTQSGTAAMNAVNAIKALGVPWKFVPLPYITPVP